MKDYQVAEVERMLTLKWIMNRWDVVVVSTDEMGLGKTIQMLGLILGNRKTRTLIVVPRALIDQWETAFIKFMGHRPLVYHGARKLEKDLETSTIVISTYGTTGLRFTKTGEELVSPLASLKWGHDI